MPSPAPKTPGPPESDPPHEAQPPAPLAWAAQLPVYQHREEILARLAEHQVIVVESPTGSGKTTQLPRILYEAGYAARGRIGVTQPRRIAAVSVCSFLSAQLRAEGATADNLVAYKMRFEDTTTAATRIKIMTDGILLQEVKFDRLLPEYDVLMVDEAHERSLNIDFVLGLLKSILAARPEFKVIISSATINAEVFSEYFDECPIVRIDTPLHPIELRYRPFEPEGDMEKLIDAVQEAVLDIDRSRAPGDVLVFLSGEREIRTCIGQLNALPQSRRWALVPLFARLQAAEQERVFDEFPGKRKIVIATNIAETSLTIAGIGFVIDSGVAKVNSYNTRSFTAALTEQAISRASCNQRRGRAGRTGPGVCYRLYSEQSYEHRPLYTLEEIHRTDLSEVVLRMAELGIEDFEEFDFLSNPGHERLAAAVRLLIMLDALDEERQLTSSGQMMVQFPILPRHARMIVEAVQRYPQVIEEVLTAAAFLSVASPFVMPEGEELEARHAHHEFRHPRGDFCAYLELYAMYVETGDREQFCTQHFLELRTMNEILNIKGQLEEIVSALGVPISSGGDLTDYLVAIARGLIQFVCVSTGRGRYRSPTTGHIFIHPGSGMFGEEARFIVAGEIIRTSRMYARSVSPLRRQEVLRVSPDLLADLLQPDQRQAGRDRREPGGRRGRAGARGQGGARDGDTAAATAGGKRGAAAPDHLRILGQTFALRPHGGKGRLVELPWQQAAAVARRAGGRTLAEHRRQRGKILLDEGELMSGARLGALFATLRGIDPAHRVGADWPRQTFRLPADAGALVGVLDMLLAIAPRKQSGPKLGFLALQSDPERAFWLSNRRTPQGAAADTLAALEALADAPEDSLTPDQRAAVNAAYRRVEALL